MPDEGRAAWFCRKAGDLKQGMYVLAVSILKNEADVEEISEEIKGGMEIVFVQQMEEVVREAFVKKEQ